MCVSCVRKGYYQYVQGYARETHSPWFKILKAIQQLERGAAEQGEGRRVPVSSRESKVIVWQEQGRGNRQTRCETWPLCLPICDSEQIT